MLPRERFELVGEDLVDAEELHFVLGVARRCEDRVGGGVNRQPLDLHVLGAWDHLGSVVQELVSVNTLVRAEEMDDLVVGLRPHVDHRDRADSLGQLNLGSQAPVELLELTGLEAEVWQHQGDAVLVEGRDHDFAGVLRRGDLDVEVAVLSGAEHEDLRLLGHADSIGVDRQLGLNLREVTDEIVVRELGLHLRGEGAADALEHGRRNRGAGGQDEGLLIDEDDLLDVGDLALAGDLDLLGVGVVVSGVDRHLVEVLGHRVPDAEDLEVAKLHVAEVVLGAEEFVSTGRGHLGCRGTGVHEFVLVGALHL